MTVSDRCRYVGSVAQLVRAPPCHGGGREFESRPVRLRCAPAQLRRDTVRFHFTGVKLRRDTARRNTENMRSGNEPTAWLVSGRERRSDVSSADETASRGRESSSRRRWTIRDRVSSGPPSLRSRAATVARRQKALAYGARDTVRFHFTGVKLRRDTVRRNTENKRSGSKPSFGLRRDEKGDPGMGRFSYS